jgi:propanol-preferring alcohol dehydrogenase
VVDVNPAKLKTASALGGVPIDPAIGDPAEQIRDATEGKGVNVSLELVGSAATMAQAVACLGVRGRAALVGLTAARLSLLPYTGIINKEAEIIGVSDHLASELPLLIELVSSGKLKFPEGSLRFVGLNAVEINSELDAVEKSIDHIRTVIVPGR